MNKWKERKQNIPYAFVLYIHENQHSKFQIDLEPVDKKSHLMKCPLLNPIFFKLLFLSHFKNEKNIFIWTFPGWKDCHWTKQLFARKSSVQDCINVMLIPEKSNKQSPFPTRIKGGESDSLAPEYFISKKTLGSLEPLPTLRNAPILCSSAQFWSLGNKDTW